MQMSMFSLEELPANHSASQDSEKDWMTRVATSCLHTLPLLQDIGPSGWFGRTSPASYPLTEDSTLPASFEGWGNSGMGSRTEFLTLSTSEWPSDAVVCSLSDTLETGDLPQRFFLSATACQGILRRAEKRGKVLPPMLEKALRAGGVDINHPMIPAMHSELCPSLKARDAKGPSSDGDGDGDGAILVPMVQPIAIAENTIGRKPENGGNGDGFSEEGPMYTLNATGVHGVAQSVGAFKPGQSASAHSIGYENEMAPTLEAGEGGNNKPAVHVGMAVRRLTPVECERLQGFPDNYTDIKPKGKATSDGPRYKALGNSMAVPVMAWIGKRIQEVDAICQTQKQ